jgi:hypothetical protein
VSGDRDEESVGRKSRAKAERRAERAQAVIQASVEPQDMGGLGEAVITSALALDSPPLPWLPRSRAADRLKRLVERQGELHGEIVNEVRRLLDQGHSWTVIGEAIGLSRQGARQRYRHLATEKSEPEVRQG